jgi:C1A family cysteine protease
MTKHPSVLVLRISRSFHAPDPSSNLVHDDGGKDRRLHAVVIVGMASVAGSTAFLARNSWGTGWGQDGHAWLPLSYVDARAVDVVQVEAGSP